MEQWKIKTSGIPVKALVPPIIAVLIVLHFLVILLIFSISYSSTALSRLMREEGEHVQTANSLMAGTSQLSETAADFVLTPVLENGTVNLTALTAYAQELGQGRRGPQVMEKFNTFNVPDKAKEYLQLAAKSAEQVVETQLHAIALIRSVYPVPELATLSVIPDWPLSSKELSMEPEQRESAARSLILGVGYGLSRQSLTQNANACVSIVQADAGRRAAETGDRIDALHRSLWVTSIVIIVVLTATFIALYTLVFSPLGRFARLIPEGAQLDAGHGAREARLVAAAYNDAHRRREALDDILRTAAETDVLTKLPNRYRMEQLLLELEESGYPVAVLMFDVNYLKQTNDTQGHKAGDLMLCRAAECISACFGPDCFRIGGDEFAAVVKDCGRETVRRMENRFEEEQKARNVSISYGCAYTSEIGRTSFRKLMDEADKKMYARKAEAHRRTKEGSGVGIADDGIGEPVRDKIE